jgi:peptidyl-dipeptidase A
MALRQRFILFTVTIIVITLTESCMKDKPQEKHEITITKKDDLVPYLDSLERTYELACLRMGVANWNSYAKEAPADLDGAKAGFANIFADTTARKIIDEWRGKSNSLADKPLARRLELWHRLFIGGAIYADPEIAKLENSLQQTITNFKFTFEGTPATRASVSNAMRQEKKQAQRHKLWSVTSQLSTVTAKDLLRLVKLRNEKAKMFGFPNYYSLSLHLNAVDEQWLVTTLNDLEEQTREPFREFIEKSSKKNHVKEFSAWDFDYTLREAVSMPDKYFPPDSVFTVIHQFQKGIGFNVDSLPIKEVVKDIPYGGLSLAINIPKDSRFLVNPTKGKGFYAVAFHEYGHSLKGVHTNVEHPVLKGYEWIPGAQCGAYEEGVADMHGEFTDDSLWLASFTQAKSKEISKYIKGRSLPTLYRLRGLLKNFFIEYEMYKNPDQNLAALERGMFKKYLLVDLDSTEQHQYAASIWYTSYPCYYQNYILAGMIATQLQEALSNKFGDEKISDPNVAQWMIDHLYSSGETLEWTERIRNATGKSLETGPYLRKLDIETNNVITNN